MTTPEPSSVPSCENFSAIEKKVEFLRATRNNLPVSFIWLCSWSVSFLNKNAKIKHGKVMNIINEYTLYNFFVLNSSLSQPLHIMWP